MGSLQQAMMKSLLEPLWYSRRQVALVILILVGLAVAYLGPFRSAAADAFWNWIDPVAGIVAFFISMVVLYNQARERWENSLEKRLTVSFVNAGDNKELARVEHAYLSGESDIRQWAQQLGFQIFGDKHQLDMNWDDQSPLRIVREACGDHASFIKLYEVTLYVYFDAIPTEKLAAFSKRHFKHSRVEGGRDSLPLRWIRGNDMQASRSSGAESEKQEANPQ